MVMASRFLLLASAVDAFILPSAPQKPTNTEPIAKLAQPFAAAAAAAVLLTSNMPVQAAGNSGYMSAEEAQSKLLAGQLKEAQSEVKAAEKANAAESKAQKAAEKAAQAEAKAKAKAEADMKAAEAKALKAAQQAEANAKKSQEKAAQVEAKAKAKAESDKKAADAKAAQAAERADVREKAGQAKAAQAESKAQAKAEADKKAADAKAAKAAERAEAQEKADEAKRAQAEAKAKSAAETQPVSVAETAPASKASTSKVTLRRPASAQKNDVGIAIREGALRINKKGLTPDIRLPETIGVSLPVLGSIQVDLAVNVHKATPAEVADSDVVVTLPQDLLKAGKQGVGGDVGVAVDVPGLASGRLDVDLAVPRKGEADIVVSSKLIPQIPLAKSSGYGRFCYDCGDGNEPSDWFVARNLGNGVTFYGNAKTGESQFEAPTLK